MKNAVTNIKRFLKSKGIEWSGDIIRYSNGEGSFYTAEDRDFDEMTLQNVILQRNRARAELSILVTKTHFIVFDKRRTRFESDFSQEWQNYLEKVNDNESENENI
ncbi:MAG: hypothetical protein IJY90_00770 [Clostridia bacterium]|nr:hypothetical protein [Clostridia bacterium]